MDIGKAFGYVFEDEKWLSKVLMGALFNLLGIIFIGTFFVLGYFVETIRNVASGNPRPLPEWDNMGEKLRKGIVLSLVYLVYALPIIIIYLCAFLPAMGALGGTREDGSTTGFASVVALAGACVFFFYGLLMFIIFPAIAVRYAVTNSFSACFQFGQIVRFIGANGGNYIIALLLSIVTGILAGIGYIACFVGIFVTSFYAMLVMGHLYGQLYRESPAGTSGFQTM